MQNLTTILHAIGLGDGEGNTSINRVNVLLIVLTVIFPKIYFAIQSGGATSGAEFSADDFKLLALALGAHQVQKLQEGKPAEPPKV